MGAQRRTSENCGYLLPGDGMACDQFAIARASMDQLCGPRLDARVSRSQYGMVNLSLAFRPQSRTLINCPALLPSLTHSHPSATHSQPWRAAANRRTRQAAATVRLSENLPFMPKVLI